jgi:type IV secretory pathway TraG/TraD family ATPase VirD4
MHRLRQQLLLLVMTSGGRAWCLWRQRWAYDKALLLLLLLTLLRGLQDPVIVYACAWCFQIAQVMYYVKACLLACLLACLPASLLPGMLLGCLATNLT